MGYDNLPPIYVEFIDTRRRLRSGSIQSPAVPTQPDAQSPAVPTQPDAQFDYVIAADGSGDFTDVTTAFSSITPGTEGNVKKIRLKPGTYDINSLEQPAYTELVGDSRDTCVIQASSDSYIIHSGSTLDNISLLDNGGPWTDGWHGIIVYPEAMDVTIKNCLIRCPQWCIYGGMLVGAPTGAPKRLTIQNNTLDSDNPIFVTKGLEYGLIENNTIVNTIGTGTACLGFIDTGVPFHFNTVRNNNITLSRNFEAEPPYAIRFTGSGNLFEGNTYSLNTVGNSFENIIVYQSVGAPGSATEPYQPNIFRNDSFTIVRDVNTQIYALELDPVGLTNPPFAEIVLDGTSFSYDALDGASEVLGTVISHESVSPILVTVLNNGLSGCDTDTSSFNANVTVDIS